MKTIFNLYLKRLLLSAVFFVSCLLGFGQVTLINNYTFESEGEGLLPVGGTTATWVQWNGSGGSTVWGIGGTSGTSPRVPITGNGSLTTCNTNTNPDTYFAYRAGQASDDVAYYSTAFSTVTHSTFNLSFRWKCMGDGSGNDYGRVVYSYNGTTWNDLAIATKYWGQTTDQQVTNLVLDLPDNQPIVYIGFRFTNDGATSAAPGFTIDNVTLTAVLKQSIITLSAPSQVGSSNLSIPTGATITTPIFNFQTEVQTKDATLNTVSFTSTGTYTSSDVTNLKLYYSASSNFSSATLIKSITTTGAGVHSFTGLSQLVSAGSIGYYWIAADIPNTATHNRTIGVDAITGANLTYSASAIISGTPSASGPITLKDVTAPTLSTVTMASNNTTTSLAKSGNIVTLTITSSENLNSLTGTIGGIAATVAGSGSSWTLSRTMTGTDTEGSIAFSISFSDLAGNAGTAVSSVTSGTVVTYDKTLPTVSTYSPTGSGVTISSNLVLTFNENISAVTGGGNITIYNSGGTVFQTIACTSANVTCSGSTATITHTAFTAGNSYYVLVDNNAFRDAAGNNYAGIASNATWTFTAAYPFYRSANGGGNWGNITSWEVSSDNVTWSAATVTPTASTASTITIVNGNNITVAANVTADELVVNSSAVLTINSSITFVVNNGTGTDLLVDGVISSSGSITMNGTAQFNATSTYNHAQNGGTVPLATWDAASNCNITGMTGAGSINGISGQSFGNFTWSNTGQTAPASLQLTGALTTFKGNFNLLNTNTSANYLALGASGYTVSINGNLIIGNGVGNAELLYPSADGLATRSTINIGGNLTMNGGNVSSTNATPTNTINFTKSGTQVYSSNSATSFAGGAEYDFVVSAATTLDMGTSVIDATNVNSDFTLPSGATLITANTAGITATGGGTVGSIQTGGNRLFNTGANYTYNSSVANQSTGSGLPSTVNNLTIANTFANGIVTLSASTAVNGILTLTAGDLDLGANNVTLTPTATTAVSGTPGAGSMVKATGAGQFIKNYATGASAFTFPIGDGTVYSPITLSLASASATGTIGAVVKTGTHASMNTGYSPASYLNRYWHFTTTGLGTYTYNTSTLFQYSAATDLNSGGIEADLLLQSWNGTAWTTYPTTVGSNQASLSAVSSVALNGTDVCGRSASSAVTLSASPAIAAANVNTGTLNSVIYSFQASVTGAAAILNSVSFTTTGTYVASDATNFQLWYGTSNTFSVWTATSLKTIVPTGPGTQTFTGLAQSTAKGTTGYYWITADFPGTAVGDHTIAVNAITTPNVTFQSGTVSAGTINAGGIQTIVRAPLNLYSYKSGSWDDPTSWTTDPSGTMLVGGVVPAKGDVLEILSGRTINLATDVSAQNLTLTIDAGSILDMGLLKFTNTLLVLKGQGTLQLATVNFPTVTTNTFVNAGGGTIEFNNAANFTLPISVYNNLTINLPTSTSVATQLSTITLNGNLYVKSGKYKINDDATTAKLSLTVNGNVTVDNTGAIGVGLGVTNTAIGSVTTGGTAPFLNYYTNFHTVILKGNFTNNGIVRFTNLDKPLYSAFPPTTVGATTGAATVYFQGATNNTVTCNGTTDFYNLVVNKGADQTNKLIINSSNYSNFRLFGANSAATEAAPTANPNLRKALWIYTGTLELQGSLIIPSLTEGTAANSEYYISGNAALNVNGLDVIVLVTADSYAEVNTAYSVAGGTGLVNGISVNTYNSLYVFGKLQMNNGYLSTRESAGILTTSTASGQIILNGGVVDTKQFYSLTGSSASYQQNGGTMILRGRFTRKATYGSTDNLCDTLPANTINTGARTDNGITTTRGSFSMNNTTNSFIMNDGIIRIFDITSGTTPIAYEVSSSAANSSVTGGTLELDAQANNGAEISEFNIYTSTPLGNIHLIAAAGGLNAQVQLKTSVIVLNNFIQKVGKFNSMGFDMSIGGDLEYGKGNFTNDANTITLNGSGSQSINISGNSVCSVKNLTINKPAGTTVTFNSSASPVVTSLSITGNLRIESGTLHDNGKTINVPGNLYNAGLHTGSGKIVLTGTTTQSIDGNGSGIFQNLELANSNAAVAPVSMLANTQIEGVLNLGAKIFNIGANNLKLGTSASITSTSGFSNTCYIHTSGQTGDGGITKVYSNTSSFVFPVGCFSTKRAAVYAYSPATIGITSAPTTYGSISVTPVGYEHPSTTVNGQSLTFYYKVKSSDFTGLATGSVTHSFVYSATDLVGTAANYVPAFFNSSSFSWNVGTTANINTGTSTISDWTSPGNSKNQIDGDFTAGDNTTSGGAFGSPTIFYSKASGFWKNTTTWSTVSHTGPNASRIPAAKDIVIIGAGHKVSADTTGSNTTDNLDRLYCALLEIEAGGRLNNGYNSGSVFTVVKSHPNGNGTFRLTTSYTSGSSYYFPAGDFSDFNVNTGTTEFYSTNPLSNTTYWLPNGTLTYGNLILSPLGGSNIIFPNNDLIIYGNLVTRGQNADSWFCPTWNQNYPKAPATVVSKTIYVKGNLNIDGGALVWYATAGNTTSQNFKIDGNVKVGTKSAIFFQSGGTSQRMEIGGSFINDADGSAAPYGTIARCDFTNIPLTFFSSVNASITNTTGSPRTTFQTVIVNKGTSQATTLTCDIAGTLNIPTDNWFTLQNGTFKYMRNTTADFTISTTSSFTIPPTAGLYVNNSNTGRVLIGNSSTVNTNDLFLGGNLQIVSGTVYVGPTAGGNSNNDIEYSSGGNSTIQVDGGQLIVNGQIRRPIGSTNGILNYTQTGGTVTIVGRNVDATYAKLEVLNLGSEFNMSGGSLYITNGAGTTYGDLYIRPERSTVTGGTIYLNSAGATATFGVDANVPLYSLTIGNNTTMNFMLSPLYLKGNLTTGTGSTINTLNNNLTINGNYTNAGIYNCGTNLTTFSGVTQSLTNSNATAITFNNLLVSSSNSLTVDKSFTVNKDLTISQGTLKLGNYLATLLGNVTNNGAYTDANSSTGTGTGLALTGTTQQQISGTGTFGRLDLNNVNGAKTLNDIYLQNDLVLTNGVLTIASYQLSLAQTSNIGGSGFSTAKMILCDGALNSPGVQKFFSSYNSTEKTFTYPIGVIGKYTPAYLKYTKNNAIGFVTLNPVNSYNTTVIDANNVLQYYWQVQSSGILGFDGKLILNYVVTDVKGGPENTYLAAKMETPGSYWYKSNVSGGNTDAVNPATHEITFYFASKTDISGDYTAGSDPAIKLEVPQYRTNKDGDWKDDAIWTPIGSAPALTAGTGPNGAMVIIDHVVSVNTNYRFAYQTTINGTLKVLSPTIGHNFGNIYGDGTLYVESGNLPSGYYSLFLDCIGNGTIEYGGTGNYNIIALTDGSGVCRVPNIKFSGTGSRVWDNKDLSVCKRLIIDGATLDNSVNNRKFTILGTMEIYNGGTFTSGSGTAPAATVSFAGSAVQTLGGTLGDFSGTSAFNNLEIANSAGLNIGTNGLIEVKGNLMLTNGIINTSSTNALSITNTSTDAVVPAGGSATSFVNGPLKKNIVNGNNFLYPIGKGSVKGHNFTVEAAGGTAGSMLSWTAEFFTPTPNALTPSPVGLQSVNRTEYWGVSTTAARTAKIKIAWDRLSDLTAYMLLPTGKTNMKIGTCTSTAAAWTAVTGSFTRVLEPITGNGEAGYIINGTPTAITTTPTYFTTAAIAKPTPIAKLTPANTVVCGTAGIPVTFSYYTPINLPYTLTYTVTRSGVVTTNTVSVTALPYTLPTPVDGDYQLTGFKYNTPPATSATPASVGLVDDDIINDFVIPITPNAGTDQNVCGTSGTKLQGNDPSPYTGTWSVVSGTGYSLLDRNSPTSDFLGILTRTYQLRWTISNGICSASDDVRISYPVSAAMPSVFAKDPPACNESNSILYEIYPSPNDAGNTYNWSFAPSTGVSISSTGTTTARLDFDSVATSGVLSVTASNACGTSPARTVNVSVTPRGQWLGLVSTDWFDTKNWNCPGLPISSTSVVIPSTSPYFPEINAAGAVCKNITISGGASLGITSAGNLQVYRNMIIDNNATFTTAGNLTVDYNLLNNGTITTNSGSLSILGSLTNNTTLTANAGSGITVNGDYNVNGTVVLDCPTNSGNTASLITKGTVTGTGTTTIKRFVPRMEYHYISSPIPNASRTIFTNPSAATAALGGEVISYNPNFYQYNETYDGPNTNNWADYSAAWNYAASSMSVGRGYATFLNAYAMYSFTGTPNTGDVVVPVSHTINDIIQKDGWNLIGNPYPSAVDWNLIPASNLSSIDNAVYFYEEDYPTSTKQYYYWLKVGETAYPTGDLMIPPVICLNGATSIVPAMQGFMVHAKKGIGTSTITIANSARIHNVTGPVIFYKKTRAKSGFQLPIIKLSASNNANPKYTDEMAVWFSKGATGDFDSEADAFKMSGARDPQISSFTSDNVSELAINGQAPPSGNTVIPLKFASTAAGKYSINMVEVTLTDSLNVYLKDNTTGSKTDLRTNTAYSFDFAGGSVTNRFSIVFEKRDTSAITYQIDATANIANSGKVDGAGEYFYSEKVTLTATPNEGYSFVQWTENGNRVSSEPVISFTARGNRSLTADFKIDTIIVSAKIKVANTGVVTGAGKYSYGDKVTLTATANPDYVFVRWVENGEQVSTDSALTFRATKNKAIEAEFLHPILTSSSPYNTGTTVGDGFYEIGDNVTVMAAPTKGYSFVQWTENGTPVSTDATYTFQANGKRNLVAENAINSYNVTTQVNDNNAGTTKGDGKYVFNTEVKLIATPETGYSFTKWVENGVEISTDSAITIVADNNRTLVAEFTINTYTVSASVNTENAGTISGDGNYTYGENVTLEAVPSTDFAFVRWTENGVEISTNPVYTFVADANRAIVAEFKIITSIDRLFEDNTVNVYPNPTTGKFFIALNNDYTGDVIVRIHTITGATTKEYRIYKAFGNSTHNFDIESFAKGLYFIEIVTKNRKVTKSLELR